MTFEHVPLWDNSIAQAPSNTPLLQENLQQFLSHLKENSGLDAPLRPSDILGLAPAPSKEHPSNPSRPLQDRQSDPGTSQYLSYTPVVPHPPPPSNTAGAMYTQSYQGHPQQQYAMLPMHPPRPDMAQSTPISGAESLQALASLSKKLQVSARWPGPMGLGAAHSACLFFSRNRRR